MSETLKQEVLELSSMGIHAGMRHRDQEQKNFCERKTSSLCFLTPRLGSEMRQNGNILKHTVFPPTVNNTQHICLTALFSRPPISHKQSYMFVCLFVSWQVTQKLSTFSQYITRNLSVDKTAERYCLNHASVVQLYYSISP